MGRLSPAVVLCATLLLPGLVQGLSAQTSETVVLDGPDVSLAGPWRIYFGDDPAFAQPDFDDSAWPPARLPGDLFKLAPPDRKRGVFWLRRDFRVTEKTRGRELGVLLGRIAAADVTYANGVRIGGRGRFPTAERPDDFFSAWNIPRGYALPAGIIRRGDARNVLAIRVYYNFRSGVLGDIRMASLSSMRAELRKRVFLRNDLVFMIHIVLLVTAMYHLMLFFKRSDEKENLFYAVTCFATGLLLAHFYIGDFAGGHDLRIRLMTAGQYFATISLLYFTRYYYGDHSRTHRLVTRVLGSLALAAAIILLLPGSVQSVMKRNFMFLPIQGLIFIYLLTATILQLTTRRRKSRLYIASFAPLFLLCIHDLYQVAGSELYDIFLFPYAIPFFQAGIALGMAGDVANARRHIEEMNQDLEGRIHERTQKLKDTISLLRAKDTETSREIELAAVIQRNLFPPPVDHWNALTFAGINRPMGIVTGDIFNIIKTEKTVEVVMADVSGHGIPAALVTMAATQVFNHPDLRGGRPRQVLKYANDELFKRTNPRDYVTAFHILMDADYRVLYANAGHRSAYLYRKSGVNVEELAPRGMILGAFEDPEFEERETRLYAGDRLVLFTDGLVELFNEDEEEFGTERLASLIQKGGELSISELAEKIMAELDAFSNEAPAQDDVSLLILELSPIVDDFRRLLENGRSLEGESKFKEAYAIFREAQELIPYHPEPWLHAGRAAFRMEDFEATEFCLLNFSRKIQNNVESLELLFAARLRLGKPEAALESGERLLRMGHRTPLLMMELIKTYFDRAKFAEAWELAGESLKLYPNNVELQSLVEKITNL